MIREPKKHIFLNGKSLCGQLTTKIKFHHAVDMADVNCGVCRNIVRRAHESVANGRLAEKKLAYIEGEGFKK